MEQNNYKMGVLNGRNCVHLSKDSRGQKAYNPFILSNRQALFLNLQNTITKKAAKEHYYLVENKKIIKHDIDSINRYADSGWERIKKESYRDIYPITNKIRVLKEYTIYPIQEAITEQSFYENKTPSYSGEAHINPQLIIKKRISKKIKDLLLGDSIKKFNNEEIELLEERVEFDILLFVRENIWLNELIKDSDENLEDRYQEIIPKMIHDLSKELKNKEMEYVGVFNKFINQINHKKTAVECIKMALKERYWIWNLEKILVDCYQIKKEELNKARAIAINEQINIDEYEKDFELARGLNRKFTILIGPTNSGKTHASFQELIKGKSGMYLAPLRLLALEGQEKINELGLACNLLTGEERDNQNAAYSSMTIEMCDFSKKVDVAVIDEMQMCLDPDRGWAWTNAICGVAAEKVILVGSSQALPYIEPLLKRLGCEYEIKKFQRKNTLVVDKEPIKSLTELTAGDAVIAFSRKDVLSYKDLIEGSTNKKVSVVYGALTPEVRRVEAARFREGKTDILVSTDAIGMGLNLPIKRIIFSNTEKYDGMRERPLNKTELKQIGGRAGRYGMHEKGIISALDSWDLQYLKNNFNGDDNFDTKILDNSLLISPTIEHVKKIGDFLKIEDINKIFSYFKNNIGSQNSYYKIAKMESIMFIANHLEQLARNKRSKTFLTLEEKFKYCCAPLSTRASKESTISSLEMFSQWLRTHLQTDNEVVELKSEEFEFSDLASLEEGAKIISLYKWLSFKFPNIYVGAEEADKYLRVINKKIEHILQDTGAKNRQQKNRRRKRKI